MKAPNRFPSDPRPTVSETVGAAIILALALGLWILASLEPFPFL